MQTLLFEPDNISKTIRDINYKQVMNDGTADIQVQQVLKTILEHPEGITDIEICIMTGISRSSVTARRNELPNVVPVGIAKITSEDGKGDRLNTLWGMQ